MKIILLLGTFFILYLQFSDIPDSPYPPGHTNHSKQPDCWNLSPLKHIHILINGKKMVSLRAVEKNKSRNALSVLLTTNSSLKRQHIDSSHQKLPNL